MKFNHVSPDEGIKQKLFLPFILFFIFSFSQQLIPPLHAEPKLTQTKELPSAYKDLIDYAIQSPDQKRSGSCLYMSSTGAMEVIANKHFGIKFPAIDSDYDLAEYYALKGQTTVYKSWYENPILKFNRGGLLSRDYPYVAERFWKASVSLRNLTPLPKIDTKTLFKTKGSTKSARRALGVLNENAITQVKEALVQYQSPVVVIYRDVGHEAGYGYWDTWHAVVILGYDDLDSEDPLLNTINQNPASDEMYCQTVYRSFKNLGKSEANKLRTAMKNGGGCRPQGVFFVRDSEDPEVGETRAPLYDKRSYDWLKYLGNHAFVVYPLNKINK